MKLQQLTISIFLLLFITLGYSGGHENVEETLKLQRQAMTKFDMLDGEWRGSAWTIERGGKKVNMTQTERVGSFLDGAVKVIEGKAFDEDGQTLFNALAIISYDTHKKKFNFRTYAKGHAGDLNIKPTSNGFEWVLERGTMKIQYTATIKDGIWHEVGVRHMEGQEPIQFFEMTLKRIGDTDWPAANPVSYK